MKQKKLYVVNQHYYPEMASTGQVFQEIAEHFQRSGYDVTVIAGAPFYHDNIETAHNDVKELNGVSIIRLWNTKFKKSSFLGKVFNLLTFQISLLFFMIFSIKSKSIVMVGTNPPLAIVCGAIGKLFRRYKFIAVIQDLYPDILISSNMSDGKSFGYKFLKSAMKFSFKKCDRIVTISEDMQKHIEEVYEVNNVKVINNMIIGEIFPIDNNLLKARANVANKLLVMYSGNFGIAHEYKTLLNAVKLLKDREDIVFHIVGGGINYKLFKIECEKEELKNIVFFPYVDKEKLNENLNMADVHIVVFNNNFKNVLMPSKYYGILACGKPVIAIADGENDISRDVKWCNIGYNVLKDNPQQLVEAIVELVNNKEKIIELRENVLRLYSSNYSKEIVFEKYSKLMEEL